MRALSFLRLGSWPALPTLALGLSVLELSSCGRAAEPQPPAQAATQAQAPEKVAEHPTPTPPPSPPAQPPSPPAKAPDTASTTPPPADQPEIKPAVIPSPTPGTVAVTTPGAPTPSTPVPMRLVLPTENDALFRNEPSKYYMWVQRNFEQEVSNPWEGGQYGYVRGPVRVGANVAFMHFHEGMDVAPIKRDEKGEPLDEVRSISDGEVVHVSDNPHASNYGRYIVVKHDWGFGPFYSLYAHLSKSLATEGQKVEPGTPIAIMGHTGVGIDKPRSHTHVEINMMMNLHYGGGVEGVVKGSATGHGIYNGLNLTGFDISGLLLMNRKDPSKTVLDFIRTIPVEFKVLVPRKGDVELLGLYPWLGVETETPSPSWEISLSDDGLPLQFKPSQQAVPHATVTWVREEAMPYSYHTRGYVTGSGSRMSLTSSGVHYMELIMNEPESGGHIASGHVTSEKPKAKSAKSSASAKKKTGSAS